MSELTSGATDQADAPSLPDAAGPDAAGPDAVGPDAVVTDAVVPDAGDADAVCPSCAAQVVPGERFCESCGADLDAFAPSGDLETPGDPALRKESQDQVRGVRGDKGEGVGRLAFVDVDLTGQATACAVCGGAVAADGYCEQCGAKAVRSRDHWSERPAAWVGGVCDRGIRHGRNEDAMAIAATSTPGAAAVLVVCDGVSSAVDSDVASLAASRAARDVLIEALTAAVPPPAPAPDPAPNPAPDPAAGPEGDSTVPTAPEPALEGSRTLVAHPRALTFASALGRAARAANDQAVGVALGGEPNPPSCTFVASVVEGPLLVTGWVGDSRAYWLPDGGPALQLSVDDSWASEAIALGMSREEAENGPNAHAITRWLGVDAPDVTPRTSVRRIDQPGWVLVCSDGLWNYCSEAAALSELVASTLTQLGHDPGSPDTGSASRDAGSPDPVPLAEELVAWANRQGGRDNITVVLARIVPSPPDAEGNP